MAVSGGLSFTVPSIAQKEGWWVKVDFNPIKPILD